MQMLGEGGVQTMGEGEGEQRAGDGPGEGEVYLNISEAGVQLQRALEGEELTALGEGLNALGDVGVGQNILEEGELVLTASQD